MLVFVVLLLGALQARWRSRNLLLLVSVGFHLPVFWLLQTSGGRFVIYDSLVILLGAGVVLSGVDWGALDRRVPRIWAALAFALLLHASSGSIDRGLLERGAFRYGSPLLDPALSTLSPP